METVTYWAFSYCVLDPTHPCECLFIFLCPALCLSGLGALHHSHNTPQPDPPCPELYKHSHEGMLFMSHTELALCLGHCITNFLKGKETEQNPGSFYPRASQHPLFSCCSQGGSGGAVICCSQSSLGQTGDGEGFPSQWNSHSEPESSARASWGCSSCMLLGLLHAEPV